MLFLTRGLNWHVKRQPKRKVALLNPSLDFSFYERYCVLYIGKESYIYAIVDNTSWAATWQNQQSDCAPSEDSDQPGHQPSLIRVFAVRMKKAWVLIYPLSAQRRLWSDWVDAQADRSLRSAQIHFVGFYHVAAQLVLFWLHYNYCKLTKTDQCQPACWSPK